MKTIASDTSIAETSTASETSFTSTTPSRPPAPPSRRGSINTPPPADASAIAHVKRIASARPLPPPLPEKQEDKDRPYVAVMPVLPRTPRKSPKASSLSDSTNSQPRPKPSPQLRRVSEAAVDEACDPEFGCKGSPGAAGLSAQDWLTHLPDEQREYEYEWRRKLSAEQFRVLRMKGTEEIHSGEYNDLTAEGIYKCSGCEQPLYSSEHKFQSGHGWPSFCDNLPDALTRIGTRKVEIVCSSCQGHIGHVFKSSRYPLPHHERHCVNSVSLLFVPTSQEN